MENKRKQEDIQEVEKKKIKIWSQPAINCLINLEYLQPNLKSLNFEVLCHSNSTLNH